MWHFSYMRQLFHNNSLGEATADLYYILILNTRKAGLIKESKQFYNQ